MDCLRFAPWPSLKNRPPPRYQNRTFAHARALLRGFDKGLTPLHQTDPPRDSLRVVAKGRQLHFRSQPQHVDPFSAPVRSAVARSTCHSKFWLCPRRTAETAASEFRNLDVKVRRIVGCFAAQ